MLLYRVFPYVRSATKGEPGHPLYVHPGQGKGRWHYPGSYLAWYLANEPSGAVGEVFANLGTWRAEMFAFPQIPGADRALGVYRLADDLPYVDLDDAYTLVERKMRPTQVIERNRPYTQAKALEIYDERRWSGIRWWSFAGHSGASGAYGTASPCARRSKPWTSPMRRSATPRTRSRSRSWWSERRHVAIARLA